jgi:hypothetical protein
MENKHTKAKGDAIIIHVPVGAASHVKVVESAPETRGQDVTIQVSRERKVKLSNAVGVIVK